MLVPQPPSDDEIEAVELRRAFWHGFLAAIAAAALLVAVHLALA